MNYEKLNLSAQTSGNYSPYNSKGDDFRRQSITSVLNGNLDGTFPRQEVFSGLENTTLRNHQKTMLYHMIELENNSVKPSPKFTLNSNIGVVGDVVGAGKSLPVLLLIYNNKTFSGVKDKYYTYNKTCSISIVDHDPTGPIIDRIHTSILVLPHTLVRQWRTYADNYVPGLKYKVINKKEHLKTVSDDGKTVLYQNMTDFLNTQLVIVSATFYSQFMTTRIGTKYVYEMNFDRVIFDEADTIHIPGCYKPNANFYWLVTSSILNLIVPASRYWDGKYLDGIKCTGFIKNVFTELEGSGFPFYHKIFFKNRDEYIQASFSLPKPIIHRVSCFTPKAVKILKGILDDKIIQMIQGDDLKGAMEQVGSMNLLKSTDDIIKISTNMFIKDLENKKREYEYKSTLTYATEESKKHALQNIQQKMDEIRQKISLIESRVQNKFCTVCNSDAETPTITMCCKNVFCLTCIQASYTLNPICPFCRATITEEDIVIQANIPSEKVVDTIPSGKKEPKLLNKIDTLIKIIKDKPDGKFLVVSLYENSLSELFEKLKDNDIEATKLGGNNLVVNKILSRFKDPQCSLKAILLNAYSYGSGLNIPETTDIIIYHKLTKELETQVIGRAQRFGRVGQLNIHYLQHDGEY
jgi:SNF2 family DNA or RNA helicase